MTPCAIAIERYKNIARWRNLWTILLFVFGASLIVFAVTAIFYLVYQSYFTGVLNALGSLVNFVGISWVLARRNEAVQEETAALAVVTTLCGGGGGGGGGGNVTAMATGPSPTGTPEFMKELEAFQAKLYLIGKIR